MTVLEGNQAYRAAMKILWHARLETWRENDEVIYRLICNAQDHLTDRENADMKASFKAGA